MRKYISKELAKSVSPLTTTRWSQEYPYTYEGIQEGYIPDEAAAGCVAVGGAQFMKYHNHPKKGDGIIPSYGTRPEKNIDGYEYQWELMPVALSGDSPQEEIIATSTLILDVGLACKSAYGPGTSANHNDLAEGLKRNFRYDKNLIDVNIKEEGLGYKYSEITELVKRDLNMGLPVMTSIPGHFVVCDGYNENGDLYFNWGWGGSPRVGTIQSVDASAVILGGRPEEDECLTGDNISTDFERLTPGMSGTISFSVSNLGEDNYNGQFNIVLADKFNVARSYLSPSIDLDLEAGQVKNFKVPVEYSNGFTFGPRTIQILYVPGSGVPRPLRDEQDNIVSLDMMSSRPSSDDIYITDQVDAVENVAKGESFIVSFDVKSNNTHERNFGVCLVDSNLNQYYELGSTTAVVKENENTSISITCSTQDVTSETTYYLLVVEIHTGDSDFLVPSVIRDKNNTVPLNALYVKNPNINIGSDVELLSNFNMSSITYAQYYYETDIQYLFSEPHSGIYMIQLSLTDDEGNVISQQSIIDVDTSPVIKSQHFRLFTPKITETKAFNLHADYINATDPSKTFYLKPADSTIVNPAKINVVYRNFYDFLFLSSSLTLQKNILKKESHFSLLASVIFTLDFTATEAYLVSTSAILADEMGNEFEIGITKNIVALRNESTPFSVECVIPNNVPSGDFTLYLRPENLIIENGEPPKKLPKLHEGIVDELKVSIE